MYLMALSRLGYGITLFLLAVTLVIAYSFRHKSANSNSFLFASDAAALSHSNSYILGFGVIELVASGVVGAIYGFSGLYQAILAMLASLILIYYLSKEMAPYSIYEYIAKQFGCTLSVAYAVLCIILLLLWLGSSVAITSCLLRSLLGWGFINSICAITGLTIICTTLGGKTMLWHNRKIWLIIINAAFILVIARALSALSLNDILANLELLAINQGQPKGFYTTINYAFDGVTVASILLFILLPLITATKVAQPLNSVPINLLKFGLLVLAVVCGILALATPVANVSGEGNSKIVTYPAQLPDGQMGYVVKAIEYTGDKLKNPLPGIIPPLLNAITNLIEPNKYDYKLASVVAFIHYLPSKLVFLVVLTIIAAYMYAVSSYLIAIAKIVTVDIVQPLNLFKEYDASSGLWCSRISIITAGGLSLGSGYFLQKVVNITNIVYSVLGLATILALILIIVIVIAKYGKK